MSVNPLFSKKVIQYERAVLDALDIDHTVFTNAQSVGDGFIRHLASVKNIQLELLRLYLAAVRKMEASDEDKEALKRLVERWMENFNQALSVAIAGSFRMALDTKQEELYDKIQHVTHLQKHLDLLVLEIAKFKQQVIAQPDVIVKMSPVLREANTVLQYYPEVLGYLNCIRSATSSRYSRDGEDPMTDETKEYLNSKDTSREIINALCGLYSEQGLEELTERVKKDVDWYTKVRDFTPSDGEINEIAGDNNG